jgi:trans-aconitate methyltransferase
MTSAWNPSLYEDRHSFVWKYGAELMTMLDPRPGERILDLGCGTGQLTAQIVQAGAQVVGLDHSKEMLERARENCPGAVFIQADAATFSGDGRFDAVFSNAVLHWVHDALGAARSIAAALKPGGRFVAEFGGRRNCAALLDGVAKVCERYGWRSENPWYFPAIGQYCSVLESAGLQPCEAFLIDRFTPLEGADGLRQWVRMFGEKLMADVPSATHEEFFEQLEEAVRDRLFRDGQWWMDYRRLRVKAFLY